MKKKKGEEEIKKKKRLWLVIACDHSCGGSRDATFRCAIRVLSEYYRGGPGCDDGAQSVSALGSGSGRCDWVVALECKMKIIGKRCVEIVFAESWQILLLLPRLTRNVKSSES